MASMIERAKISPLGVREATAESVTLVLVQMATFASMLKVNDRSAEAVIVEGWRNSLYEIRCSIEDMVIAPTVYAEEILG